MSTIKVDTVRPVTADASLTLQADVSGTGVTGLQIGVDPSNNGILISDNLTGLISAFANSTAPNGWLACDGSAISRTTYARLFTAISTTWGVGDGSTTFNLPDLRGAFLRGSGDNASNYKAKDTGSGTRYPFSGPSVGSFEDDQMQGHYHSGHWTNNFGNSQTPGFLAVLSGHNQYNSSGGESTLPSGTIKSPTDDGTNGTPRADDETRPFNAGILYCIKF